MVPSLPLLSCESSVSVKENPDRKKIVMVRCYQIRIFKLELHFQKPSLLETFFQIEIYTAWKSVRTQSLSGPYFPTFGLDRERYSESLRVQLNAGKYGPEKLRTRSLFTQWYFQIPSKNLRQSPHLSPETLLKVGPVVVVLLGI